MCCVAGRDGDCKCSERQRESGVAPGSRAVLWRVGCLWRKASNDLVADRMRVSLIIVLIMGRERKSAIRIREAK